MGKIKTLLRVNGQDVFFLAHNGWLWIGKMNNCGYFKYYSTITEVADVMGVELYFEKDLKRVPSFI